MPTLEKNLLQTQVERILQSDQLHGSEVLRRLLTFLAEKSIAGEADQLKEYTVAIDGLGKSSSYDPRHNSAVRIQVGRLRQKLGEYYRAEGKEDEVIISLPKGRFKLACEQRSAESHHSMGITEPRSLALEPDASVFAPVITPLEEDAATHRSPIRLLALALCVGLVLGGLSFGWVMSAHRNAAANAAAWSPEMESLWGLFAESKRPLIVAIEDPLFVEVHTGPGIYFRDRAINQWKDAADSPALAALRGEHHDAGIEPSRYYTAFGEVNATFLLGKLLGSREQTLSVLKTSQLSWQQLADNNVIFVGVQNLFFSEQTQQMPLHPQLLPVLQGIQNVQPRAGEPALFTDQYVTAPSEEGMAYALVTRLPGPLRTNDVESFTSNRSAGYVGAVQSFADPAFARLLVAKLKENSGGHMPRYYQVLLKVKFKDDVPTETTLVLSRELR